MVLGESFHHTSVLSDVAVCKYGVCCVQGLSYMNRMLMEIFHNLIPISLEKQILNYSGVSGQWCLHVKAQNPHPQCSSCIAIMKVGGNS